MQNDAILDTVRTLVKGIDPALTIHEVVEPTLPMMQALGKQFPRLGATVDLSFTPDRIAIVHDSSGKTDFLIVNVSKGTLGLTELGLLHVFAKILLPKFAIQIVPEGLSGDLVFLLMATEISSRILPYGNNTPIIIGSLCSESDEARRLF
jgi:hypothetical protein